MFDRLVEAVEIVDVVVLRSAMADDGSEVRRHEWVGSETRAAHDPAACEFARGCIRLERSALL